MRGRKKESGLLVFIRLLFFAIAVILLNSCSAESTQVQQAFLFDVKQLATENFLLILVSLRA